ncbi:hypothetical protein GCM10011512_18350 [Tersicoccus solisilvae]|uniref:Heavy metal transporter n=1 Tax=Tersicoccus solisilvae TaxID=1882339 RepID=A0ABQ1P5R4_9MICC|nr:hypothetical protein [Tersicoccus solisilvae]GGC91592.1 hypothetical protein GCM10011512_18350 [Tersicoccus solisilvae]
MASRTGHGSSPRRRRARGHAAWRGGVIVLVAVIVVVCAVVAVTGALSRNTALITEECTVVNGSSTYRLQPDQAANAAIIAGIAVRRNLPPRAASIAIATALQESKLRNIEHGDMDSIGLFQQRPSQGWGTEEEILDPVFATNAFYNHLVAIPGYQQLPITEAAQRVQLSAYPEAYAQHEPVARSFASALTGQSPASLTCTLRPTTSNATPAGVLESADTVFGEREVSAEGATAVIAATGTDGWAVAHWAVATASGQQVTAVEFDGQRWERARGAWQPAENASAERVRITVAQS